MNVPLAQLKTQSSMPLAPDTEVEFTGHTSITFKALLPTQYEFTGHAEHAVSAVTHCVVMYFPCWHALHCCTVAPLRKNPSGTHWASWVAVQAVTMPLAQELQAYRFPLPGQ